MNYRDLSAGQIYEIRHKWLLPRGQSHGHDWQESKLAMYVGEKKIKKSDNKLEMKHELLVDGKSVEVDTDFLRFLEPISESR